MTVLPNLKLKKKYLNLLILFFIFFILALLLILLYKKTTWLISLNKGNILKKECYQYFNLVPHLAKETLDYKYNLNKRLVKKDNSYSITGFIYIFDWKYKYFSEKSILEVGPECCNINLDKISNDLIFSVFTKKNVENFTIKNIDINRWFHFAIVVNELQIDLYLNGKLYSSFILKSLPKINFQDLLINKNDGFSGLLYDIRLYEKVIYYNEIYNLSRISVPLSSKYFKDTY